MSVVLTHADLICYQGVRARWGWGSLKRGIFVALANVFPHISTRVGIRSVSITSDICLGACFESFLLRGVSVAASLSQSGSVSIGTCAGGGTRNSEESHIYQVRSSAKIRKTNSVEFVLDGEIPKLPSSVGLRF